MLKWGELPKCFLSSGYKEGCAYTGCSPIFEHQTFFKTFLRPVCATNDKQVLGNGVLWQLKRSDD